MIIRHRYRDGRAESVYGEAQCTLPSVATRENNRDANRFLFDDLETDWQASFTAGIRDFPRALAEGRETLISGERARDIVKFAYALIIAARCGDEVRPDEIYEKVPEWRTAVQRFFLEARDEQLRAVTRGMIEHHLKAPGGDLCVWTRARDRFARLGYPPRHIGLFGSDPELELLGEAYRALGPERVRSVRRPEAGEENEILEMFDAMELWQDCEGQGHLWIEGSRSSKS